MKKKVLISTVVGLACLLAGCGETTQGLVITQKEQMALTDYKKKEEAEETASQEKELYTTQTCQDEAASEDGKLKISIDAVVDTPNADRFPVYKVTAKEFTQDFIDTVTETFFGDAPVYDADEYYAMTKEEIAVVLKDLKEELNSENINLEEYARTYGIDDITEEEYKKELQSSIDVWERQYKDAPETPVKTEVKPEVKPEVSDDFGNYYLVELDNEQFYQYNIKDFCGNTIDIKRSIKERFWIEYDFLKESDSETSGEISESEAKGLAGIEMEDAKAIADEKLEALDLPDMELYDWDYAILRTSDTGGLEVEDQVRDGGYWFYYTRKVNDIPLTFTYDAGGGLESMEDERETWLYEAVNILVTDDGIEQVYITSLYDIVEEEISSVQLMEFDEIMEIFKNMMVISNEDVLNYENSRIYNIDHIKLGYMRVYDPDTDSRSGTLIPVWDFFGGFDCESITEEGNMEFRNYNSFQSYMTINAIDGTVIDRSLGY